MNNPATPRMSFSTDGLPVRDRFQAFCEEVIRRYTTLDVRAQNEPNFHAAIELRRTGTLDLGVFKTSAAAFDRSRHLRDGDDGLIVMLCQKGAAYQTQRESNQKIDAGEAVVCDCAYSGGLHMIADSEFLSVKVPRNRIASVLPDGIRFPGAKLDRKPLARRLLFGYLAATHNIELQGDARVIASYEEHLIDLIALSLGVEGDAAVMAEHRGAAAARRLAILSEIKRRSGDAGLSAATLAALLGVTPRYVHLLLEETGKSFTRHVLERRLERAAALLCDPRWSHRRIADIAAEAGFTDLSYFNRSFRRHFSATPSDIRAAGVIAAEHGR
jgi:AraC-like DNA-binding protein